MSHPVLVTVEAVLRPEARERLLAAMPDFLAATRAEPGCLAYGFYAAVAEAHMAAPPVFTTLPL